MIELPPLPHVGGDDCCSCNKCLRANGVMVRTALDPVWPLETNPVICPNCSASYFSVEALEVLAFVGIQEGGEYPLALFNCGCNSTLAIEVIREATDLQLL